MDGPIKAYAGISDKPTEEQRKAQLAKCADLRKMYNDAGVNIHIQKTPFGPSDEAIEFNFEMAKALGCVGITLERSEAMAKKLAPFADKHKIWGCLPQPHQQLPDAGQGRPDPGLQPVHRLQLRRRALLRRDQGQTLPSRCSKSITTGSSACT